MARDVGARQSLAHPGWRLQLQSIPRRPWFRCFSVRSHGRHLRNYVGLLGHVGTLPPYLRDLHCNGLYWIAGRQLSLRERPCCWRFSRIFSRMVDHRVVECGYSCNRGRILCRLKSDTRNRTSAAMTVLVELCVPKTSSVLI